MRHNRLAAALALTATALLLGGATAEAATPNAPAAGYGGCFYNSAIVPARGSITVDGSVSLGVVHLADGVCTHPYYDVILAPGQDTYHNLGWAEVSGAYIGPGFLVGWTVKGDGTPHEAYGPCYVNAFTGGNLIVAAERTSHAPVSGPLTTCKDVY
jgi:hypothetical protein